MNGKDESIVLTKSHIWALASTDSRHDEDAENLPARALSLLRVGRDVVLVPDHEGTREFAEFCKEVLSLKDWQIIYTEESAEDFMSGVIDSDKVQSALKDAVGSSSQSSEWMIMPSSLTDTVSSLSKELSLAMPDKTFSTFGEHPDWVAKYGARNILFRNIKQLEEPCLIETVNPAIRVPRGYVCSTVQCLLVAFRLLTHGSEDQRVLIKPVASAFLGAMTLSSVNELKYYDFPFGEVIMQEILQTDEDGDAPGNTQMIPLVQYLSGQILGGPSCQRIVVGNAFYGIRSAQLNKPFQDKALSWAQDIVSHIEPVSAGSFGFVSVGGEPMMVDATPGALTVEHFCRLFVCVHSPGSAFCCWNLRPTPGMDVWTLWTRLCDCNIAFMPNKPSAGGVFPLLFLKNSAATLIAMADDEQRVSSLRAQADELFRLNEKTTEMKNVALSEDKRRIWVNAPRPEYRRQTQRYNLPARMLSLLRKKKDIIILQGGHEPTREYWEFCKDVMELDDDQAIFTEGEIYNLDDDIDDKIISQLRARIASSSEGFTLVPYGVTYKFDRWASQLADLGVAVFGESLEWVKDYGHKGILHRRIDQLDKPSIMELIDPSIRVAKGYTCSTVDELLKAYQLLDCEKVVIKPVFGAAGEGIMFVSSEEELKIYDFCMGDVCLEEFLNLDTAPDGMVLSPAMHYNEGVLIGKGLVDQIMVGTSYMGWRKSNAPKAFQSTANRYMSTLLEYIKPKGPGGVDYLSVNGLPVLSDINTGRFNGAHSPKLFMSTYAPDKTFYCWKGIPGPHLNIYTFWNKLVKQGIAFVPGKSRTGVFPLLYLRGLSGMFIAVADTSEQADELHVTVTELLRQLNDNRPKGTVTLQKPSIFKKADITRKSATRIWATSSPESLRRVVIRYENPLRPACLLRPGRDFIILPGNNEGVHDFFEFLKEVIGLSDSQVIWTNPSASSVCLDKDVDDTVLAQMQSVTKAQEDNPSFLLLPGEISDNFLSWANKVDVENVKVFGETPTWIAAKGFNRALHRHMAAPEEPCLLESQVPELIRAAGYIASNNEQLIEAYNRLGGKGQIITVPCISTDGKGSLTMASVAEMELYSFPYGEVVVREVLNFDKSDDGLPVILCVTYLKGEIFGQGFTDIVKLGDTNNGLRASVTSDEFQSQVSKLANKVIKAIAPEGPGSMEFASINGKPVLFMLQTNRFTPGHYAKFFLEEYAPQANYTVWNFHPPEDVDIWTWWSRLTENNAQFTPGVSTRGVFPLLFLKNHKKLGVGTFIAIGQDESDVEQLKSIAEEALRESTQFQNIPQSAVAFNPNHRRIWFHSPRSALTSSSNHLRYTVPCRVLSFLRPGMDMVVLPGKNQAVREFWDFMRGVLHLKQDQVIFTAGEHMELDDDTDDRCITSLKAAVVTSLDNWTLVPLTNDEKFRNWSQQLVEGLGVNVFGEEAEWMQKWGNKGIIHRHINTPDQKSLIQTLHLNIKTPKGYQCSTMEELLRAYEMLGCKDVVLKPVATQYFEGPLFIGDIEELKLIDLMNMPGDIIIEQHLEIDRAPDGLPLAPSVHYNDGCVLNKELYDHIIIANESKGLRPTQAPKVFQKTAKMEARSLMSAMKPKGPGGFDFLSVGGHPMLSSVSTGTFTASHIPKLFQQTYAPDKVFYSWEQKPDESVDIATFWKRLKGSGKAFIPGKSESGVFPLVYIRGQAATFIAIGNDELSTKVLHESAKALLTKRAPTINVSAGPVQSRFRLTLIKNAHAIFSPDCINARHILVAGKQIVGLLDDDAADALVNVSPDIRARIVDASGCIITPGFVDCHVHVTGGGGELGPASRTQEAKVQEVIEGGLTTVVGILGTDCVSRSLENLVTKVRALNEEGITAYMWTGAYRLPAPTLTGSIRRDVCLIEQCIGVGECSISDHRGSQPTTQTIIDAAVDASVGGMLSGKAGIMYCHIGERAGMLSPLRTAVEESDVPITTFLPTHLERSEALIDDGAAWVKEGGYADFTCFNQVKVVAAVKRFDELGVPMERVCISTDSYGSLSSRDDKGKLTKYGVANPKSMLKFLWNMYFEQQWPLEKILPLMTRNPANILKLPAKGVIEIGADADLLLLDKSTLKLKYVFAKGCVVMTPRWTHAGLFGTGATKAEPLPTIPTRPARELSQPEGAEWRRGKWHGGGGGDGGWKCC